MGGVFSEGDKACKRSNQRTCSTDVDAHQKMMIVVGELRQENRRGYVTDALAGKNADKKRAPLKELREKGMNRFKSRHISREDKETNKGEKQSVVYLAKSLAVKEKNGNEDYSSADEVGNYTEDDGNRQGEKHKVDGGSPFGKAGLILLVKGDGFSLYRHTKH